MHSASQSLPFQYSIDRFLFIYLLCLASLLCLIALLDVNSSASISLSVTMFVVFFPSICSVFCFLSNSRVILKF